MPSLTDALNRAGGPAARHREWIRQLVGDWQVIADLTFSDVLLWLPAGEGFILAAHARPATAATAVEDDLVGDWAPEEFLDLMHHTLADGGSHSMEVVRREVPIHVQFQPVVCDGHVLGILGRESGTAPRIMRSRIEGAYMEMGDHLAAMVSRGEFPQDGSPSGRTPGGPRVGDGVLRLDAEGRVTFISPNGVSNLHRLGVIGELQGRVLAEIVTELLEDEGTIDETLAVVVMGRAAWRTEIEARGVILTLQAIPLIDNGERRGAVLLCRDITDTRRRERELLSKDATIREIHHRVKNNLQTVSALLRLQSRRSDNPQVVAALDEAVRRVSTIAVVHDTLTRGMDEVVDFDDVFSRLLHMAAVVATPEADVKTSVTGSFGEVGAGSATSLAIVLTELVTNAVEHGLGGRGGAVSVDAQRDEDLLHVTVKDNGRGIEPDRVMSGLGTQIVSTLVRGELRGRIQWDRIPDGGTAVHLVAHVTRNPSGE